MRPFGIMKPQRPLPERTEPLRVLFLDDDPARAGIFLAENPRAVWVETVADCLARLEEQGWDEVHLDHDLGGERFVDLSRDDCGMEVVRWLCLEPRPHLSQVRFFIHSHNSSAATMMSMQMMVAGYRVEYRPFGAEPPSSTTPHPARPSRCWLGAIGRLLHGRKT
jgi:hypothetical protein